MVGFFPFDLHQDTVELKLIFVKYGGRGGTQHGFLQDLELALSNILFKAKMRKVHPAPPLIQP